MPVCPIQTKPLPIMLKFLPIMILNIAQKFWLLCTHDYCDYATVHIQFIILMTRLA